MEEIEIPNGAMAFIEGMFYKIDNQSRVFHWGSEWTRSAVKISAINHHLNENAVLIKSMYSTISEWNDYHNCSGE